MAENQNHTKFLNQGKITFDPKLYDTIVFPAFIKSNYNR